MAIFSAAKTAYFMPHKFFPNLNTLSSLCAIYYEEWLKQIVIGAQMGHSSLLE